MKQFHHLYFSKYLLQPYSGVTVLISSAHVHWSRLKYSKKQLKRPQRTHPDPTLPPMHLHLKSMEHSTVLQIPMSYTKENGKRGGRTMWRIDTWPMWFRQQAHFYVFDYDYVLVN